MTISSFPQSLSSGVYRLLIFLCFFCCATLSFFSLRHKGPTYDELAHFHYGYRVLEGDPERYLIGDNSKMPFSVLNALPKFIGNKLEPYPSQLTNRPIHFPFFQSITTARLVTIICSLILAWYVYRFSYELYGNAAALFSLFLYCFDPNILAHGQLITTDLYAALMVTVATFYFWKFVHYGGFKNALISALTLGLSQLAKYSCLFLYIIFVLILLIHKWPVILQTIVAWGRTRIVVDVRRSIFYLLLFGVVNLWVINIGFCFKNTAIPLAQNYFESNLFLTLQKVPFLNHLPLPLPYAYLRGIDMLLYHDATGIGIGNLYLLGNIIINPHDLSFHGFSNYFLWALLFKMPLATMAAIFIAVFHYLGQHRSYKFFSDEIFLLIPVIFLFIYFNFFFKTQIGIRYLLPLAPLMFIFCGHIFKIKQTQKFSLTLVALVTYLIISSLSYYPHFISYLNELVWDRKQNYKYLADSNLDWGGNDWYVKQYIKKHPDSILSPLAPRPGRIIVSVNNLVGAVGSPPQAYAWLRENFKPTDQIAYNFLVFEVTPEELKRKVLK